jgi:hypothetical protein
MIPTIEILNHQYGSKIEYFTNIQENRFSLKSKKKIKKGEQVFNNYGGKSNDSFLLGYGFVIPNNSEDCYFIRLGKK